eukprot:1697212-Amphidinium_carterae.1
MDQQAKLAQAATTKREELREELVTVYVALEKLPADPLPLPKLASLLNAYVGRSLAGSWFRAAYGCMCLNERYDGASVKGLVKQRSPRLQFNYVRSIDVRSGTRLLLFEMSGINCESRRTEVNKAICWVWRVMLHHRCRECKVRNIGKSEHALSVSTVVIRAGCLCTLRLVGICCKLEFVTHKPLEKGHGSRPHHPLP